MAKGKVDKKSEELAALERIKKLAVVAMFSDDELLDELVLKGGNAMALIHKLTSRESVDLDFSMKHDFPDGVEAMTTRIGRALQRTFPSVQATVAPGFELQPFDFYFDYVSALAARVLAAATEQGNAAPAEGAG